MTNSYVVDIPILVYHFFIYFKMKKHCNSLNIQDIKHQCLSVLANSYRLILYPNSAILCHNLVYEL